MSGLSSSEEEKGGFGAGLKGGGREDGEIGVEFGVACIWAQNTGET